MLYTDSGDVYVKFCSENQQHREHLEDLDVDEGILKWILKNWVAQCVWLRLTQGRDQ